MCLDLMEMLMFTSQVTARAEHLGSGLLHQGCLPNPNQFIGVFAQNRPEVTTFPPLSSCIHFFSYEWVKLWNSKLELALCLFQWIISELACYTYSMVVVPLYDTLGADAIRFIINTGKSTDTEKTLIPGQKFLLNSLSFHFSLKIQQ